MLTCTACGRDNPDDARFCSGCGAKLAVAERAAPETRKTVTILFTDVVGSTAVGERLDPESLRRVMGRYFDAMSGVLERHGATVEKFIGDAIMAVFGLPLVHEDDALRAARAAVDMRDRLAELNAELKRDYGVAIQVRTGVTTGEVVAGDPSLGQRLVTGDAVNTAARLEQAAQPGEILLGEQTWRLVRDAVEATRVEAVDAKGKATRVPAFRLEQVREGAEPFARRYESPLVGRERELALLRQAYRRAVDEQACHLFTLLGAAGIGKSRLTQEFVREAGEEATVVSGRCLSYGEGITYWPLIEILEQLGSEQAVVELLEGEPDGRAIVNTVFTAVGHADAPVSPEETPWAVRKLFEALAREQPLVVVLDDLQWAEPTLLDLVEYVADWSRDAPILLLCCARPELLDERAAWAGGKLNATSILLEPLTDDESSALIDELLGGSELEAELRRRIEQAAEGNPLFVEQMLAMLSEDGGDATVPPTIQALLAARLDRLAAEERSVLQHAAVIGTEFWLTAVGELARNGRDVARSLQLLVRRELIRPHRSTVFPADDAFRFRHALIRDAAYAGMAKELRAQLHERFAEWLEAQRSGFDEIVGYHLEQAYRYRSELGPADERTRNLARAAGERLGAAGERALARSDIRAAVNLLDRSAELLPAGDPRVPEVRLALAEALEQAGELDRAAMLLDDLIAEERVAGPTWHAKVLRTQIGIYQASISADEAAGIAEQAIAELAELDDHAGLARAWQLRADVYNVLADIHALESAMREALAHARQAQDARLESACISWLGVNAFFGDKPVAEARVVVAELAAAASTPFLRAQALLWSSAIAGLAGECDQGTAGVASARATFADLGMRTYYASTAQPHARVQLLCGNAAEAERLLREADRILADAGERGIRSTSLLLLSDALHRQGRHEDAERAAEEARAIGAPDDAWNAASLCHHDALTAAARGDLNRAEAQAREAAQMAENLADPVGAGLFLMTLADVLRQRGTDAEAEAAANRALELFSHKGAMRAVERAEAFLAELART